MAGCRRAAAGGVRPDPVPAALAERLGAAGAAQPGLPGDTPELAIRLLTQGGVDRDGRQLRPPMPRFRMTVSTRPLSPR
jgi:hypothetical protein